MPENGDPLVVRLVEDEPLIALWLSEALQLEAPNITVKTATRDFERLLSPAPWEDVNVAVVDLMLPGVSGIDILRYLANVHPKIRRIAMTASLPAAQDVTGLADVVLVKPFSHRDLLNALEQ